MCVHRHICIRVWTCICTCTCICPCIPSCLCTCICILERLRPMYDPELRHSAHPSFAQTGVAASKSRHTSCQSLPLCIAPCVMVHTRMGTCPCARRRALPGEGEAPSGHLPSRSRPSLFPSASVEKHSRAVAEQALAAVARIAAWRTHVHGPPEGLAGGGPCSRGETATHVAATCRGGGGASAPSPPSHAGVWRGAAPELREALRRTEPACRDCLRARGYA